MELNIGKEKGVGDDQGTSMQAGQKKKKKKACSV